jgi:hypothetical protein
VTTKTTLKPLHWLCTALTALTLTLCACDGGGDTQSPDSLAALGIDDGAATGVSKSLLARADEDSSIKLKTGAELVIPKGAVDDDVQVVMKRPKDIDAAPLLKMVQKNFKVASAPYVVTPHGQKFNKDVELALPIAKGDTRRLVVAQLEDEDDTSWELHQKPKVIGTVAKFPVKHFSVYVLLEQLDDDTLDAGGEVEAAVPDAGDEQPMDAGVDAVLDAGPDAAPDAARADSGTGSFTDQLLARFTQCDLVAQTGRYGSNWGPRNDAERCAAACLFDAHCQDLAAVFCTETTETPAYQSCILKCFSYSIVECETAAGPLVVPSCDGDEQCLDGRDEANCSPDAFFLCDVGGSSGRIPTRAKCDGELDCDDGADETNCPAGTHFMCANGEKLPATSQCDGELDCADGSDEACTMFECKDGAQQVPVNLVCDLMRDCSDGSDEDQGCMKLTCEVDNGGVPTSPAPDALPIGT